MILFQARANRDVVAYPTPSTLNEDEELGHPSSGTIAKGEIVDVIPLSWG